MNPDLPAEAIEFGDAASRAFAARGGIDLARAAESDSARRSDAAAALQALGVDDLDARADADARMAAAALCEAAGRVVLPYPVPGAVLRDTGGRPFAPVAAGWARIDHGDLFAEWRVATLAGDAAAARPVGPRLGSRLGPFVTDVEPVTAEPTADRFDVAAHLTLTGFYLLGATSRAVEMAVDHVTQRVQFGKPLSAFQAVQFQLADASVAVAGLRELALFTLWRLDAAGEEALVDALALRVHALDVARSVLRAAQQLHGAAGFCDEYDISVIARHAQAAIRIPWSAERAAAELMTLVSDAGFVGLFEHAQADR